MGVESVIRRHIADLETQSPSGFAIAFHIKFTTPAFLFQTYAKDWIDIYSAEGMVMADPIVVWGFGNNGAIRWSELKGDDPMNVLERSAEYGLRYGVAVGIEENGSRSVAGFARPDREYTDAEIDQLIRDVTELHNATAEAGALSEEAHAELKRMSIEYTHPNPVRE